jgi:hypothetical protein
MQERLSLTVPSGLGSDGEMTRRPVCGLERAMARCTRKPQRVVETPNCKAAMRRVRIYPNLIRRRLGNSCRRHVRK